MKAARITAVGLVAAVALWIASGHLSPHEAPPAKTPGEQAAAADKPFRVGVLDTHVVAHQRKFVLSGRTEADRKVMVLARTGGVLNDLRVRRGSHVKAGDILAVLSDEAREAQVLQARALLDQRRDELEAKRRLIAVNAAPRLEMSSLEAQVKAAEAGLAGAEAERDRGVVRAPWDGVVTDVPAEIGTSAFSFSGKEIAQMVALDPLLAVVEVSERKLAGIELGHQAEVRLVTGQTVTGKVRYVSKSASQTTRTYRVEVEIANPDMKIPDGITAEVTIPVSPVPATRIPRSALVFSSKGELGIRIVDDRSKVAFVPVAPTEDAQTMMWVTGVPDGARVIVQGQDFVRETQRVETVAVPPTALTAR